MTARAAPSCRFTMTLFPPLGSRTRCSSATRPRSPTRVVPAVRRSRRCRSTRWRVPTFKTAGDSYQYGAETGVRLAEGATTIDTNLLKLRDGAAELLAGLIKLSDGSDQLATGLAGEAAPGARELADGLGQIDDGAGQLADGAGRLADGSQEASTGSQKLEDGLRLISDGLDQLSGVEGAAQGAGRRQAAQGRHRPDRRPASARPRRPTPCSDGLDQLEQGLPAAVQGSAIDQAVSTGRRARPATARRSRTPGRLMTGQVWRRRASRSASTAPPGPAAASTS